MTKKNGLTAEDKHLLGLLNSGVNNADGDTVPGSEQLRLNPVAGNPPFKAQFDVSMIVKYGTVAAGTFTERTAAYVLANFPALATQLTAFIFGNSDLAGGFKKSRGQFPLSGGWAYGVPFVYGRDYPAINGVVLDATAQALLQVGDLVIPYVATVAGPVVFNAMVILRCQQVAYATLVDSLNSDRFWVNNIRYVLTDTSAAGLLQYDNEIKIQAQSLFGLFNENSVSPTSNKTPQQFQDGIIDLPINQGVDKNVVFGSYINYNSVNQKWSIFVRNFDRLKA